MRTSSAWRRKTLYPASAMAFRRSSSVVVLIVSTDLMRKGSMIVRNSTAGEDSSGVHETGRMGRSELPEYP